MTRLVLMMLAAAALGGCAPAPAPAGSEHTTEVPVAPDVSGCTEVASEASLTVPAGADHGASLEVERSGAFPAACPGLVVDILGAPRNAKLTVDVGGTVGLGEVACTGSALRVNLWGWVPNLKTNEEALAHWVDLGGATASGHLVDGLCTFAWSAEEPFAYSDLRVVASVSDAPYAAITVSTR